MDLILFGLIRGLHNLASALWVGGIFSLGFVFLPPVKKHLEVNDNTKIFLQNIQKRITTVAYLSIVTLFVTGIIENKIIGKSQYFFDFSSYYSIVLSTKNILVFLMVFLAFFRGTILKLNFFDKPQFNLIKSSIMYINIFLGISVIVLSGLMSVL